jgi:hypothetical protein
LGRAIQVQLANETSFYQGGAGPIRFIFEAAEVEKIGEDKYRVKVGFVTACEDKIPKWSFSVKDAVFRIDRQVNLKHPIFRIKKLPLFYSPYLYVPTNERERQTGFLIPSTGNSSSRGRSISDAFFLTLGRSADVLANAEYYSLRGVAGGLEFNARPSERSMIYAHGFFAADRLGQGGQSAQIKADTRFENGFRAVADVYTVSSPVFRQVYGDSFYNIVRPDEVSSGFLTRNFSTYSVNVFGERRLTEFPEGAVTSRTFPSFNLSGHSRQVKDWPVYLSFETSVEGLSRSDIYRPRHLWFNGLMSARASQCRPENFEASALRLPLAFIKRFTPTKRHQSLQQAFLPKISCGPPSISRATSAGPALRRSLKRGGSAISMLSNQRSPIATSTVWPSSIGLFSSTSTT